MLPNLAKKPVNSQDPNMAVNDSIPAEAALLSQDILVVLEPHHCVSTGPNKLEDPDYVVELRKGGPELDGHDAELLWTRAGRMLQRDDTMLDTCFNVSEERGLGNHDVTMLDACFNASEEKGFGNQVVTMLDVCLNASEKYEVSSKESHGANGSRGENIVSRMELRPTCEVDIGPSSLGVANGPGVLILNQVADTQLLHTVVCDGLEVGNINGAPKTVLFTSQVEGSESCAQSVSHIPDVVPKTQIEDGDDLQRSNPVPISNASLLAEENLCEVPITMVENVAVVIDSSILDKEPHEIAKSVWHLGLQLGVSGVLDETTMIAKLTDMESRDRKAIGRSTGS
ncbi:hypothetical protein SESBI_13713 [Sesbania bispinosa]|nr:hypothetical protein SESBI_13713 [Sesbania bispinosa]